MMASGGKFLETKLFQWSREFIVKARAVGVCFDRVILLKSRRFSRCFSFPGIGSGEVLGTVPCCVQSHPAESSCKVARGGGAAVPCSWSPLQCARCKALVAFAWVLSCEPCREHGNVC